METIVLRLALPSAISEDRNLVNLPIWWVEGLYYVLLPQRIYLFCFTYFSRCWISTLYQNVAKFRFVTVFQSCFFIEDYWWNCGCTVFNQKPTLSKTCRIAWLNFLYSYSGLSWMVVRKLGFLILAFHLKSVFIEDYWLSCGHLMLIQKPAFSRIYGEAGRFCCTNLVVNASW